MKQPTEHAAIQATDSADSALPGGHVGTVALDARRPRSWAHKEATAYRRVRRDYVKATNALVDWLAARLADIDEIESTVSGRTKDVRSVEAKLRARERTQPGRDSGFADLPDLIGVRVVVRLDSEIAVVAQELHRRLVVDKDVDVRDERGREETPGYRGRHFDVRALPDPALPEFLQTHPAEIQVRTRGADLWASVEHDLRYKSHGDLPPARSRQFVLAASLLELAERELDDLRAWQLATQPARATGPSEAPLDEAGLAAWLAQRYPGAPSTPRRLGWMLELLSELNLGTAQELTSALPRRPDQRVLALVEGRASVDQVRLLDDELLLVMPEAYLKANKVVPDERNPQRLATLARRMRRLAG
jgi:ppGpp synthetase/RelA/SpoT-type nucleotidyltranferase